MKKAYSTYSDKELVTLMKSDKSLSESAFTELYNRYSSIVHAYCYRVFNNNELAEDIFQETFIKFYQNVNADYQDTNVPGYLIRIARNLCLNYKRDKKFVSISLDEVEHLDFPVDSSADYDKKELLDLITLALDLLEYDFRECFVLREYDGLSYSEIAQVCNITEANAKSRVFRAKQKIKEILTPYLKEVLNS